MAAKTPPAFTKGQNVLIVGWFASHPAVVTEDSDKTHTMVKPGFVDPDSKPWRVLNSQLQAVSD